MKAFLDVKTALEKNCRRGEPSVRELKWGLNLATAEDIATDRLVAMEPRKKAHSLEISSRRLRIGANRPPSSRVDT